MGRAPRVESREDVLRVAAQAALDPRTVKRALSGAPLRSAAVTAALVAALRELGFEVDAKRVRKGTP